MQSKRIENQQIAKIVQSTAASYTRRPLDSINPETDLHLTLGMSSLQVVELITALNGLFRVDAFESFSMAEVRTVGDLCKLVAESVLATTSGNETAILSDAAQRANARRARRHVGTDNR